VHFNLYKDLPTHLNSVILLQLIIWLCAISSVMYGNISFKTALSNSVALYILDTHESRSPVPSLHSGHSRLLHRIGYPGPLLRADLRQIFILTDPVNECRNKHKIYIYIYIYIYRGGAAASASLAIYVSWSPCSCHGTGSLVEPFRAHTSRSLFDGLPWFLQNSPVLRLKVAILPLDLPCFGIVTHSVEKYYHWQISKEEAGRIICVFLTLIKYGAFT
jgi:hypothetical protein